MKQIIGQKLKELRGFKRQKEIAAALNISLKRYQGWEEGRAEPGSVYLVKIAEYYKINVKEILQLNYREI